MPTAQKPTTLQKSLPCSNASGICRTWAWQKAG